MLQNEIWIAKYNDVFAFIETNKKTPSRYDDMKRGLYMNWRRHNRELFNAGKMKEELVEKFCEILELMEK